MGSTHPVIDDEAEQKLAEKLEERNLSPKVHSRGKLVCWQLSLNKQQARCSAAGLKSVLHDVRVQLRFVAVKRDSRPAAPLLCQRV